MKNRTFLPVLLISASFLLLTACSGTSSQASSAAVSTSSREAGSTLSSGSGSSENTSNSSDSSGASASSSGKTNTSAPASSASTASEPAQVTITVPEGFTLAQIAARLEAHNVCKKADFVKAAQTYDFSYYPLVKKIASSSHRAYKLEGYLYPNTYQFTSNMKPQDAVGKFLRVAESEIDGKYSYSGMTTDQLITLASIIEREADNPDDMKKVSSVFHNRLKQGMILQADSTRDYCNNYLIPVFGDSFKYYYNTYPNRAPGLPAGPICNPGAAALEAAAHPSDTKYLYFATATNHKYYYGATMEERNSQMKADNVTALYAD